MICLLPVFLFLFTTPSAFAAVLGCAANGHVPNYGVNYGTSVIASGEPVEIIEGDPLIIAVGSWGSLATWVCQPSGITMQYFNEGAWGTNVWLNGDDDSSHYSSAYYGNNFTLVSNTLVDPWTVETVWNLGTKAELKQIVTYNDGDYYYKKRWELTNTSGGDLSDLRFFHGGDTYFGGIDSARSWWDSIKKMVYVNNANFSDSGIMGFYGASTTPTDHFFGGHYSTGNGYASDKTFVPAPPNPVVADPPGLPDFANSDYVDAGYQLEWDRAGLADGATWIIEAYETWTDPTAVQVLAPADEMTEAGRTLSLTFQVHNLDDADGHTFDLAAVPDPPGWTASLPGGATVTAAALERVPVAVNLTVPPGAAVDTVCSVTLTASDFSGSGSSSNKVKVFDPDYDITPSSMNFGSIALGANPIKTITVSNSGTSMDIGVVANSNALAAPYSISEDNCSGKTLANGERCTIDIMYSPTSEGNHNDSFNIPVLNPVGSNHVISVSGTGILTPQSTQCTLEVNKTGVGAGQVSSNPPGIDCGINCQSNFGDGARVVLTGAPDFGSAFDGWSGDAGCLGNGNCTVTMDQDYSVTATFNPDDDGDGISTVIEDEGPNGGDANEDGRPDSLQPDVATFQDINGAWCTLIAESGTYFEGVIVSVNPSPGDAPEGAVFPAGFFGFTVLDLVPGASTMVTLILHELDETLGYYRYGPTPDNITDHWYHFTYDGSTGMVYNQENGQTQVVFYLQDGQRGDDDLTANGVIQDLGGPYETGYSTGGGGGGCSCGGPAFAGSTSPIRTEYDIGVIIAVLLGGGFYGYHRVKRRRRKA